MIKHFFSVLIFVFIFLFNYFVISTYISKKTKDKVNANRLNVTTNIENNLPDLPLLKNDTNDVIEFNSGYNEDNQRIKRNFWKLFKTND